MATHKLAILVSAVGAAKAAKDLKGVDKAVSNIGSKAGQGLRNAGSNLIGIGALAAGGIALAVKSGIEDLATLESAVTSVDGSIKQMGLTGKVTGGQIAGWANEIEASVQAAFDDKDITAATASLIRYGHVTQSNIRPAMVVMTDLAAKTGSVESASKMLAKALADPTKASTALRRAGVILTKQQQKQIDAFVKVGDKAKAQKAVLEALASVTKGAAANSVGEYGDALHMLSDASEDAKKALATGFLPVIKKVADLLSTEMAKPETINNLRNFGEGLAKGLDSLIEIARNLPWGTIGTSLKIAGAGAKSVLEAFSSMPPWVQTAILTGWGLNKLTGGALGGIVGELGKGLIKGVLGMTAGVVNINAGVVNGGGGLGGGLPGAAAAGGLGLLGTVAIAAASVAAIGFAISQIHHGADSGPGAFTPTVGSAFAPIKVSPDAFKNVDWAGIGKKMGWNVGTTASKILSPGGRGGPGRNTPPPKQPPKGGSQGPGRGGPNTPEAINPKIQALQHGVVGAVDASKKATQDAGQRSVEAQGRAGRDVGGKVTMGTMGTTGAVRMGAAGTMNTVNSGTSRVVGAIAANRPIVTTNVKVFVTPAAVTSSTSTSERYGSNTGSGGSGSNGANKPT